MRRREKKTNRMETQINNLEKVVKSVIRETLRNRTAALPIWQGAEQKTWDYVSAGTASSVRLRGSALRNWFWTRALAQSLLRTKESGKAADTNTLV